MQSSQRSSDVLPREPILFRHEDTAPYECDALTAYRASPMVVVLPETEAQVAAILRICHRLGVPVVARGAGTGLSGGATPHRVGRDVVARQIQQNPENRCRGLHRGRAMRRSQPGHQRGRGALWSVLRAGPEQPNRLHHRRQCGRELRRGALLEIRTDPAQCAAGARLHGGRRRRWNSVRKRLDAAGLDLLSVVIGSEGMLAVTTEVTVKLIPKPLLARCIMASFEDIESAGAAVASVIARGIIPAGLEIMDQAMTAAVEAFVHADYDLEAAAILLCESDGTPEEVEEEIARMERGAEGRGSLAYRGQPR